MLCIDQLDMEGKPFMTKERGNANLYGPWGYNASYLALVFEICGSN